MSAKMTWFVTKFLSGGTTIPTVTKQKLLSFWQLYNTSLNAAEQCQFIFCHNPNTTTWKVHNLVLVLQISRCFLGQQNLQDLGLVLNLLKKRLILFASVWQVLPSRPAGGATGTVRPSWSTGMRAPPRGVQRNFDSQKLVLSDPDLIISLQQMSGQILSLLAGPLELRGPGGRSCKEQKQKNLLQ